MHDKRDKISLILNIIIVILTVAGMVIMFGNSGESKGLMSVGIENFKYFTVLSNVLCGLVAALWIVFWIIGKKFPVGLKLFAAAAVGLTFLTIAAFLAPMYPELNMYEGANLWFHLIVPLTAMLEFVVLDSKERIPFSSTWKAATFSFVYGAIYLFNNIINGIGEWPDTNDWYGFLNWGYPIGILIFAVVVLINWLIAVGLRFLNNLFNRLKVS